MGRVCGLTVYNEHERVRQELKSLHEGTALSIIDGIHLDNTNGIILVSI